MKKHLSKLALIVALGSGFALAQGQMPQQQQPPTTPQNSPVTPQSSTTTQSSMPASGDVQGNIQSALQKDPSLASSSISVQVTGKTVELSGTVPTRDAKDSAERIARENAGDMKVKNSLKVSAKGDNPPQTK